MKILNIFLFLFNIMINYVEFDNNHIDHKKYIIVGAMLYLPLITLNIMTYITLYNIKDDMNNLINNHDNIEYINKVKYLVDYICNTINC